MNWNKAENALPKKDVDVLCKAVSKKDGSKVLFVGYYDYNLGQWNSKASHLKYGTDWFGLEDYIDIIEWAYLEELK